MGKPYPNKQYMRAVNNRDYLCEIDPERVTELRTFQLLGLQQVMIQSPCVLHQDLLIDNQKFRARGDYQLGHFKCNAEYHGNDSWLIRMWNV
ncbi:hypothetical protein CB3_027 [Pectobacterium phage vB_PatP_CB3]|uniref:Uncharacterized protein n=2 Tax=Cbunavirus CB4 TaxID=2845777 RepID=A0A2P0N9S5_9CAUD|nr:hypothetical protein HWB09_gp027 [Pectobacterium phage vB_PatP_CB4]AQT27869.1 hypothetical protein CB4_027 [Pectobacterium phage vB_PatP_CB4]ARB11851.1 hypothetical protein CB3_027 [Pectobacterium phage vB_PatP_CB3]